MKPFQGILNSAKRLKDRSINVTFNLQEITSSDFMEVDTAIGDFGVVYFKPKGILTDEEKKAIDGASIELNGKTQSERIRNVLFVLNQQENGGENFDEFYKSKTEELIQHFKNKLDPEL